MDREFQGDVVTTRCIYQANLQNQFGGGEVYTSFFSRALIDLGYQVVLFVSREADFWKDLLPGGVNLIRIHRQSEIGALLPRKRSLLVTHTVLDAVEAQLIAAQHVLCGFVHMPLYERDPPGLRHYHWLLAVSKHVMNSMHGRTNIYSAPMYAVADLNRGAPGGQIVKRSEYDWDRRKMRDRLLGLTEPFWRFGMAKTPFAKLPGLTLGIVSRLTPIKQFPLMFDVIAPVIARYRQVRLEIFGSGGYASVRDLRKSLLPMSRQVRYWGHQRNVAEIYRQLDYVMSGLPEKEALGLNVIEAQQSGTPVLAVRAPPFTETVQEGVTGFLFDDPRGDGGKSFDQLLQTLLEGTPRLDPLRATAHLERFSYASFCERVAQVLDTVIPVSAAKL
jgi:glycosyltransferase involved in cell wall biosynthesis